MHDALVGLVGSRNFSFENIVVDVDAGARPDSSQGSNDQKDGDLHLDGENFRISPEAVVISERSVVELPRGGDDSDAEIDLLVVIFCGIHELLNDLLIFESRVNRMNKGNAVGEDRMEEEEEEEEEEGWGKE